MAPLGTVETLPITEMQVKALIARPGINEVIRAGEDYRVAGAAWTGRAIAPTVSRCGRSCSGCSSPPWPRRAGTPDPRRRRSRRRSLAAVSTRTARALPRCERLRAGVDLQRVRNRPKMKHEVPTGCLMRPSPSLVMP